MIGCWILTAATCTDGGLETDLIFHHGVDLPEFASFPLRRADPGARAPRAATTTGTPTSPSGRASACMLEAPTWRANPDWGAAARLRRRRARPGQPRTRSRSSTSAATRTRSCTTRASWSEACVGPARRRLRAPATGSTSEEYADYHRPQLASFQGAGADLATALTLVGADEAIGIVTAAPRRRAADRGLVHGRDRRPARRAAPRCAGAIEEVDAAGGPDWFLVNCAHPTHVARGLRGRRRRGSGSPACDPTPARCRTPSSTRPRSSTRAIPPSCRPRSCAMVSRLPGLRILGGCCGTDARHVAALWGV